MSIVSDISYQTLIKQKLFANIYTISRVNNYFDYFRRANDVLSDTF
jgi:hypothetical protein